MTPYENSGGLLGIDPSLLAQYQLPDEERKRLLLGNFLLGIGGQMMTSKRGNELGALGSGAVVGAQMGQQAIKDAMQQRGMTLTQAMTAHKLKKDMEITDLQMRELGGGNPAPAFSAPGPASDQFGPPKAPPQSGSSTPGRLMQYAKELGVEEPVRMALLSGGSEGWRAAAKIIADASKPDALSPGQTAYKRNGQPAYSAPNISPGMQMGPNGAETIPGFAQSAQEIAAATEAAKAANDVIEVKRSDGSTIQIPRAEYLKSRQNPNPSTLNFTPDFKPTSTQLAAIQQDYPNYQPQGGQPRVGESMPPLVQKQAEANISTAAGAQGSANTDFITNSYRPVMTAAAGAKVSNVNIDQIERLPIKDQTGWGAGTQIYAAKVLTGLGIAPDKVKEYATQGDMFNRAVMTRNWEVLNQAKGMQTEGDSQRALKTDQMIQGTPEYNQWVRDVTKATNNLHIKQAQFYSQHYSEALKSGNPAALESAWAEKAPSLWDDPAMKKWQKYGVQQQQSAQPTPEEAIAELRRRGKIK